MDTTQTDATPGDQPLKEAIEEFLQRGSKSGNYKSNLEYVLGNWVDWAGGRGETTLADVDKETMAEYAGYLRRRVNARQSTATDDTSGITASTAWAYYDYVSAFLDHCLKWDKIIENPAQKAVAKDELPERPSANSGNQQFWSPTERRALLDHVDRVASEVIDEKGTGAVVELRDKALVYVIAFTGARGGEILADSRRSAQRDSMVGRRHREQPDRYPRQEPTARVCPTARPDPSATPTAQTCCRPSQRGLASVHLSSCSLDVPRAA